MYLTGPETRLELTTFSQHQRMQLLSIFHLFCVNTVFGLNLTCVLLVQAQFTHDFNLGFIPVHFCSHLFLFPSFMTQFRVILAFINIFSVVRGVNHLRTTGLNHHLTSKIRYFRVLVYMKKLSYLATVKKGGVQSNCIQPTQPPKLIWRGDKY